MIKRIATTFGVLTLALRLAACNSQGDNSTAPASLQLTPDDTLTAIVRAAGIATAGDMTALNDDTPANTAWVSGCTLNTATGRFDCPPVVRNGLTVTRSVALYDANGQLMTSFDSTTASVNVQATEVGVRPTALGADTISGSRNVTATGLLGHNTTRIWDGNGGGTDGAYWTDSVATRHVDVTYATTLSGIVIQLPRADNPWPIAGTITRQVNGTGEVTRNGKTKELTISRTVTVTFNGTEFVPLTVGDKTLTLDLATGTRR